MHIFQLTYSTTRYGLYEVVSAELRKGDGKKMNICRTRAFALFSGAAEPQSSASWQQQLHVH